MYFWAKWRYAAVTVSGLCSQWRTSPGRHTSCSTLSLIRGWLCKLLTSQVPFAASVWVSWEICFWNAPSWSQPPHRKCNCSETTILWGAWATWGGPEVWNTMKKERQTDRQTESKTGQGTPWCQMCERWRDEAILAVDPPATPVDATCSKDEVSGWAPLTFLTYKIMSKINGWFKPLRFGILSYVAINNWNKTYRNMEIINTFHKSNTCNLHQNQETEYCQHFGSCFCPIPVMASPWLSDALTSSILE